MLKPTIEVSGDGSHTVKSPIFNTLYHSNHGALSESMTVFIDAGLNYLKSQGYTSIEVFEMGFGTGLNALLTYQWAVDKKIPIKYHTVEAYPVDISVIEALNYGDRCGDKYILENLHLSTWDEAHTLSKYFTFKKYHTEVEKLDIKDKFNVIFYDAFAPNTQAHLWEAPLLQKMYNILNPNGILVTFCAQGAFKRHLKSVGFDVYGIPGPPGKREMTRALKK